MFTKSQVQNMDPGVIANIVSGWDKLGTLIEQKFCTYVSSVANTTNGGYWEGVAAEAAHTRADGDRKIAVKLVDEVQAAACAARGVATNITNARQSVLDKINEVTGAQFSVGEDWSVTDASDNGNTDERSKLAIRYAGELTGLVNALHTADNDGTATIDALVAGLVAKFTDPASLSREQAGTDGVALSDLADGAGVVPLDVLQRLAEAGSLTPEQLAALQSGQPVAISASQMEYLNGLQDALDGLTPQQLEAVLNALPPQARAGLANSWQIVSNERVTASVDGNGDVPTNGAFGRLPQKIQDSLTRQDLVVEGGYTDMTALNGVADNQAIGRMVGMSDPGLRAGSSLDTKVLDVAGKYLDAQVHWEADKTQRILYVDGRQVAEATAQITEPMFQSVAADKFAVAAAVNGPDGATLLSNVFHHEWRDDGQLIADLFHTTVEDATAIPGDPIDTLRAEHHGDIANAVAQYLKGDSSLFSIAGQDPKTTVGELNPVLLQHVADDLAPYYSTFAGGEFVPNAQAFETTDELANLYKVLSTDWQAGMAAATHTYAQELVIMSEFGAGNLVSTYGQVAGQMHEALLAGTAAAQTTLDKADVYDAQWQAAVHGAQWDAAKSVATTVFDNVPHLKPGKYLIDIVSPLAKLEVQGIVDQGGVLNPDNAKPSDEARAVWNTEEGFQAVIDGLVSRDPSIVNHPDLAGWRVVDDQGNVSLEVKGFELQDPAKRILEEYGVSLSDWREEFAEGSIPGKIDTASGR